MTGLVTALADLALLRLARRREGADTTAWLLLLTQVSPRGPLLYGFAPL